MNTDREFERIASEWLDTGTDSTPPEVIDAVLLAVRSTPQERDLRVPLRTFSMKNLAYAAAAIAVVAVTAVAALYAFTPRPDVGSEPTASPMASQSQTASPAPALSTTFNPDGTIDTTSWTTYESNRYGISIGHPPDWTEVPADHEWSVAADANNHMSTGHESFIAADGNVRVSAWSVAFDFGTTETVAAVEAWAEAYCRESSSAPCDGIHDRAVPLCVEQYDCHPGILVAFESDVHAFFSGGIYGDKMVVVAVWRGDTDPEMAEYGGARRLLQAFLSTMEVCEVGGGTPQTRGPGC